MCIPDFDVDEIFRRKKYQNMISLANGNIFTIPDRLYIDRH